MDREKKKETYVEDYAAKLKKKGKLSKEEQKAERIARIIVELGKNPNLSNRNRAKIIGVSEGTI